MSAKRVEGGKAGERKISTKSQGHLGLKSCGVKYIIIFLDDLAASANHSQASFPSKLVRHTAKAWRADMGYL